MTYYMAGFALQQAEILQLGQWVVVVVIVLVYLVMCTSTGVGVVVWSLLL